jgi:hypothetical protein
MWMLCALLPCPCASWVFGVCGKKPLACTATRAPPGGYTEADGSVKIALASHSYHLSRQSSGMAGQRTLVRIVTHLLLGTAVAAHSLRTPATSLDNGAAAVRRFVVSGYCCSVGRCTGPWKDVTTLKIHRLSQAASCVVSPAAASCATYVYPSASVSTDIASLCGSMPDMPGCSISRSCEVLSSTRQLYERRAVVLINLHNICFAFV